MSDQITLFTERLTTPIGTLLLLTDTRDRVRAVDWADCGARMHRLLRRHYGEVGYELCDRAGSSSARDALDAYFAGDVRAIDPLPVETGGTAFQQTVWRSLRGIPSGATATYAELAATIGHSRAVRAVGLANGANPIGVIVPCHRVVGANASLTGYAGGLERKRWLLEHEGAWPIRPALPAGRDSAA